MRPEALLIEQNLRQQEMGRPPCKGISRLNTLDKANICSPYPVQEQLDYIVWGDSHAGMLAPELAEGMHGIGRSGALAIMASCHPLLGVYTVKKKTGRNAPHSADTWSTPSAPDMCRSSSWPAGGRVCIRPWPRQETAAWTTNCSMPKTARRSAGHARHHRWPPPGPNRDHLRKWKVTQGKQSGALDCSHTGTTIETLKPIQGRPS